MPIYDEEQDQLVHYGTPRHSGRYPWGSHGNEGAPNTSRSLSLLEQIDDFKKQGLSDKEIADGLGMSIAEMRSQKTVALAERKAANVSMAVRLRDKGVGNTAAAKQMGIPEPTFRSYLKAAEADSANILKSTSDAIRRRLQTASFVDIGTGVATQLGMSEEKLKAAVQILKNEGFVTHNVPIEQIGTGKKTNTRVIAPKGTTQHDVFVRRGEIRQITEFTQDGGRTFTQTHDPLPIEAKRVSIRYHEQGGGVADGVLYVRPGVEDVSIGPKRYAQVRVQVGDGHYLKGMAIYKNDLPPGVDIEFNTNKSSTGNKFDAMKPLNTLDPELPFNAITHQIIADHNTPNERVTSVMNIVGNNEGSGEEGSWATWRKTLSTQFLSKQSPALVREQLVKTFDRRRKELDEIKSLTNPAVKKKLLKSFSDSTDSSAVHLDTVALNRKQAWHVILPVNSLKPNEIYAPNFDDGEQVVLIRYPHGGKFELPELTVNNKNREARQALGTSPEDAIGIHHSVASRLSGADFDGDTVIVVPNKSKKIATDPPIKALMDFDPVRAYPEYDGMHVMTSNETKFEMGSVSNLITDMTIQLAPKEDIIRAVKHSMVVIDAEKKRLNYKQSYIDNGIAALKKEYQGKATAGAHTLISRATSRLDVPDRVERPHKLGGPINKETGALEFVNTGKTRQNKKGKEVPKTIRSTKLAETSDAHTLSSGTPVERLYADHSNRLKAMANEARLEMIRTPSLVYSQSAKKIYAKEVVSLDQKLKAAQSNRPRERQAQIFAGTSISQRKKANPGMSSETLKKVRNQALNEARRRAGADKKAVQIDITDEEWNAIQAGAISHNQLTEILTNTDVQRLRTLATPRRVLLMSPGKTAEAKNLLGRGYTRAQVAERLGVSLTTLDTATGPTTKHDALLHEVIED